MKIGIIGCGAAGMMAAIAAAEEGASVTVFDPNEKAGKKLYITGKGRCNFTNVATGDEFFANVVTNSKFLYSAISAFDSSRVLAFFEEHGMPYKIERGGRAFPESDRSSDVIRTLMRAMENAGVSVRLNSRVTRVTTENGTITGIVSNGKRWEFDRVVLATGGMSYPSTGSTGDGYRIAKETGHRIVPLRPALTPILTEEAVSCEGLSLKNVRLSVFLGDKRLASEFGEMLFTKDGISGPIALTVSSLVNRFDLSGARLSIDLKPALTAEQLDARILRDFEKYANKEFRNALGDLLPKTLIPEILLRSGIDFEKKVHQITSEERKRLVAILKNLCYSIRKLDTLEHAIVTAGGVDVRDVKPSTLESKIVPGLYFAGEILDVDALTGGFNLQIAFSTGYLAGKRAAEER